MSYLSDCHLFYNAREMFSYVHTTHLAVVGALRSLATRPGKMDNIFRFYILVERCSFAWRTTRTSAIFYKQTRKQRTNSSSLETLSWPTYAPDNYQRSCVCNLNVAPLTNSVTIPI